MKLLLTYLAIVNAAAFLLMLIDKIKAIKEWWRIPERVLLTVAAIGGSLGCWIAMYLFRHKTRYVEFAVGVPILFLIHIALLLLLFYLQQNQGAFV